MFLEEAHNHSVSRNKQFIQVSSVASLIWGSEHDGTFKDLQEQLRVSVKLYHRNPDLDLCVFTDASDRAVVVMQCKPTKSKRVVAEQRLEPLVFLNGEFAGP